MKASQLFCIVLPSFLLLILTACAFSYPPGAGRSESRSYNSYNPYASNSTRGPAHAFFGSERSRVGSSPFLSETEEKERRERSIRRFGDGRKRG